MWFVLTQFTKVLNINLRRVVEPVSKLSRYPHVGICFVIAIIYDTV
jgi:hypothetical protein